MKCPHGVMVSIKNHYGVNLFIHEDGTSCSALNSLKTPCTQIYDMHMKQAITAFKEDCFEEHWLRLTHAVFRTGFSTRRQLYALIDECRGYRLTKVFEILKLVLQGDDDFNLNGLYLMELYFVFDGFCRRLSLANPALLKSNIYFNLHNLKINSLPPPENEIQRQYASYLETSLVADKKCFHVDKLDIAIN